MGIIASLILPPGYLMLTASTISGGIAGGWGIPKKKAGITAIFFTRFYEGKGVMCINRSLRNHY
jgi:hypothetical protein